MSALGCVTTSTVLTLGIFFPSETYVMTLRNLARNVRRPRHCFRDCFRGQRRGEERRKSCSLFRVPMELPFLPTPFRQSPRDTPIANRTPAGIPTKVILRVVTSTDGTCTTTQVLPMLRHIQHSIPFAHVRSTYRIASSCFENRDRAWYRYRDSR
ncbi:hypothetical protein QBC45DRAFT_219023 [Copromyces sp. CBS 386.78]|nr:hypothetical protein QBC45DRAFT_219023 [Copromyces sp. CBS 386.78]